MPLPNEEVEALIDLEWITEPESKNCRKVGEAIAAILSASGERAITRFFLPRLWEV